MGYELSFDFFFPLSDSYYAVLNCVCPIVLILSIVVSLLQRQMGGEYF